MKIVDFMRNLKERFTGNGRGFNKSEKKENFFEHFQEEKEHLKKDVNKYDKSTYPHTYVWVEKYQEEFKPKKNIIKAKKNKTG